MSTPLRRPRTCGFCPTPPKIVSVVRPAAFASGGEAYDAFMGRYAVLLAPLLADLAGVAVGQRALDVDDHGGATLARGVAERAHGQDLALAHRRRNDHAHGVG